IESAFLQSPRRRQPGDATADNDDRDPNRRRRGAGGGAVAERVADRHIVVDESAGERAIALDRQADEGRGGRETELAPGRSQRLISRHSDSSVRTSTWSFKWLAGIGTRAMSDGKSNRCASAAADRNRSPFGRVAGSV